VTDVPVPPPATGPGGPSPWQFATVTDLWHETPRAKTFRLALERPTPFLAGQHFIVRLTAPDGYRAQRSYSVATAPGDDSRIDLTVELLEGGEVSGYLHDVVVPGDTLEVRGPIGGWFVWRGDTPALLIGGGSGLVPLMSMLRLARATGRSDLVRLVVSVRRPDDLYYRDELPGPEVTVAYSREAPPGADRAAARLMAADLEWMLVEGATSYVCGSAGFAEAVSRLLVELGVPVADIRVERFGPSG
jgi:ferredoxin-NADP reductase